MATGVLPIHTPLPLQFTLLPSHTPPSRIRSRSRPPLPLFLFKAHLVIDQEVLRLQIAVQHVLVVAVG